MRGIRELSRPYEEDLFEIEKSDRRQAGARALVPGKTYTLYTAPNKSEGVYTRAVAKKRKLACLYPGHARFERHVGGFKGYECFTYGELAAAINKPRAGTKIIREEEDE